MKTKQRATLPERSACNARIYDQKEKLETMVVVAKAPSKGGWDEPVRMCHYIERSSNASVVYTTFWYSNYADAYGAIYGSGSGSGEADGGSYHDASASAEMAIAASGITLSRAIDGGGEGVIGEALIAIALALGYRRGQIYLVRA